MTTLQDFLARTSAVPTPVLRSVMLAALTVEVPRDQQSYARFYDRVLYELAVPEERCVAVGE